MYTSAAPQRDQAYGIIAVKCEVVAPGAFAAVALKKC